MKKGEIYQGIIEKVEFPNKGIVQIEDKKVIVKNGMPGQTVRFIIKRKEADWKGVSWKSYSVHHWKQDNLCAAFFRLVGAVCIRPCPTKISWK